MDASQVWKSVPQHSFSLLWFKDALSLWMALWTPWAGPSYPRVGGGGTERVKVQSRLLGGRTVHVFKDLPAVTAGTGRRVDVTRDAWRRRWEFIAQPHGNLSLISRVLLFPRFKAVCTPIQGSSGVLKISSTQTLWNTIFCFCKRFAKQMRTRGTREPDLRGVYYQLGLRASICKAVISSLQMSLWLFTMHASHQTFFSHSSFLSLSFISWLTLSSYLSLSIPDPSWTTGQLQSKLPCLSALTSISSHTGGHYTWAVDGRPTSYSGVQGKHSSF